MVRVRTSTMVAAVVEGEAIVATLTLGMVVVMISLPDPVDAVPVGS